MTQDSLLDQRLDEYQIEKLLGRGGMARVYQGVDVNLQRKVAIKVIDTPYRADSDYLTRFKLEAQAIAQLEHPNIVRLYRYGEWDGLLYMAMQYVDGVNLYTILNSFQDSGEFIEPKHVSWIIRDVCEALDYIHQHGVIHRDVKPSNIMINAEDQAILTDFGLALLTDVGTRGEILGSPDYIAPEQAISSAKAVPQSDLYAVGVILYEMLTGQLPFNAEDPLDLAMLHVTETPPPPRELRPDIGAELEAVILKAIAKELAERYQTGCELVDALDHALRVRVDDQDTPPPTVARLSMLRRVKNREGVSVPAAVSPSPALERREPPMVEHPPSGPPSKPSVPRLPVVLGAGALWTIFVLVLLCGVLVGPWMVDNFLRGRGTESSQSEAVETMMISSSTVARTPLLSSTKAAATRLPTSSATSVPTSSRSPTPTPTAAVYALVIMTRKDGSLVIVNQSEVPFPLASLHLEGKDDTVLLGSEWEIETLQPGECVYAVKDVEKSKLPEIECQEVGERLPRENKERFWKEEFDIYFDDEIVDSCKGEKEKDGCSVIIDNND